MSGAVFTDRELCFLLDAVMAFYKAVEETPRNDGSELPEIDALQHKIEELLRRLQREPRKANPPGALAQHSSNHNQHLQCTPAAGPVTSAPRSSRSVRLCAHRNR